MDQTSRQLKDAHALRTELLRKSRDHETLNTEGQDLMARSDRDADAVQSVLDNINHKWTDLSDG